MSFLKRWLTVTLLSALCMAGGLNWYRNRLLSRRSMPTGIADGYTVVGEEEAEDLLARFLAVRLPCGSYGEQIALGAVMVNRLHSPKYPDTLVGVIRQKGVMNAEQEAAFYDDTDYESPLYAQCLAAARMALWGMDPTDGSTGLFLGFDAISGGK